MNQLFDHEIEGNYLQVSKVVQNIDSTLFAIAYMDDYECKMLLLDEEGEQITEFEVSGLDFNINDQNVGIDGIHEPMISVCFNPDSSKLFASVYDRINKV